LTDLYSDNVGDFEIMLNTAEPSTRGTDVLSASMLGEGLPIGGHAPHTNL
jgi:hypothetical protein